MPRRRRGRFSKLNELLRGIGGVPDANADGAVAEYYKYRIGKRSYTVPNALDGKARNRVKVALIPFATSPGGTTPANRYTHKITAYSYNGMRQRAGDLALIDFGVYLIENGEKENPNYYPALLRCSYSKTGATTIENKPSGITNEPYKYTPKRTFSFPLGRTLSVVDAETGAAQTNIADVDELDVVRSVTAWLKAGTKGTVTVTDNSKKAITVSYDPEKFASSGDEEKAPNDNIADVNVG